MGISKQQLLIAKLIKFQRILKKQPNKDILDVIEMTTNTIDELSDSKLNEFLIHIKIDNFIRKLSNLIGFSGLLIDDEAYGVFQEIKQIAFEYKSGLGSVGPLM